MPDETPTPAAETTPAKRMSLSQVVEHLLNRGSSQSSSVSLTRNAKGETQIEVVVRTDAAGEVPTIEDAEEVATAVYDRLRETYAFGGDNGAGGTSS